MIRRNDSYYQLVTNMGKPLRNFHNWIKSNLIYTYCSKKTLLDSSKIALDVLDIGFGRGGDLMKFYYAKVKSVVATDINESSIFSGSDGGISRYNAWKKKLPGFPKMSFVVADAGQKLDYINQLKNGKMNDQNVKLLKQTFGESDNSKKHSTFDVINAQFMIHYLLKDENTWTNFIYNVNKYLRVDGYILMTTLDGNLVNNIFNKSGDIKKEYITDDGQKRTLYGLIKKYPDMPNLNDLSYEQNVGKQVDANISIFMEDDTYIAEYLVNPKFLIQNNKKFLM
jgi:SAM-dependent methyltransferase